MRFTVFLVILVLLYAGSLYALDTTGLVLYLPFDEGSGVVAHDASENGNDGELEGNVEWVDGVYGKAISISDEVASDMLVVTDSDSLDSADELTMAAWVYVETLPEHNAVLGKRETYMIHISNWSG